MKKTATHTAALKIQSYIEEHKLAAGDKLPSEKLLTQLLSVGRSSLRESLRILEGMGVVKLLPGKGAYVGDSSEENLAVPLKKKSCSWKQVLEVRRILEYGALELAIEHADDDDLARIYDALITLEQYEFPHNHAPEESEADLRFHEAVYASTKNPLFLQVLKSLDSGYYAFWDKDISGAFPVTLKYHRLIYLAIKSRDKKVAKTIVDDLISTLETTIEVAQKSRDI